MRMHSLFILSLMSVCFMGIPQAHASDVSKATHHFIENAMIGGQFEIESSRYALQNSQNDDVKNFAQEMVDDHTQNANQLSSVIATTNPDETQPTVVMDAAHQEILDKLNDLKGDAFDKLYVQEQVKSHKDAVSLFQKYATTGDNKAVRGFATQTLPMLKKHQSDIQQLHKSF